MANYLEQLSGSGGSRNIISIPATSVAAADWEIEFKFRVPSGTTGEINLMGDSANTNNRFYVNFTTGVLAFRAAGTAYSSAATGIVAGAVNIVRYSRVGTVTRFHLNGTQITQLGYVVALPAAYNLLGGASTTASRLDLYYAKITSSGTNRDWNANGITSGTVLPDIVSSQDGTLTNFVGNPWKSEATINTIDNPIPADGAFGGSATGFTAGAATLTTPVIGGGTVSASVTIAAGADPKTFSATYPPPVSTQAYPIMGASHTHTLTQVLTAATAASVVGAPDGYALVTLNFPVTTNPAYITANFVVTPVTGDLVATESAGITMDPSGFWTAPDPVVTIVIHQVLATGVVYIYEFTISESGVIPGSIDSVGTVRIGGTAAVTVSGFDEGVDEGTIDGVPLASASTTSITLAGFVDTEQAPRPGSRELTLTGPEGSASTNVPVNPPAGWSYYTVTGSFIEAVNGSAIAFLPVSENTGDFIFYPTSPASGKFTTVSDVGVVTNNVGNQELFILNNTTKVARSFDIETTAGAGSIGSGSGVDESVISMVSIKMVAL